jgi:hypothetical protein
MIASRASLDALKEPTGPRFGEPVALSNYSQRQSTATQHRCAAFTLVPDGATESVEDVSE